MLATTSERSEVAELLALAQTVLLRPDLLASIRVGLEEPEHTVESLKELVEESQATKMVEFTRDVVQVEIRAEGFAELQLIDLPGLIASAQDEQLVELITTLNGEYIQRSNTLIAMCCPFDDDLENQKVRAMAKEFDPDGQRTVGILTKADKIPEGLEGERMQLLSEPTEDYFLQHGYYAVKNPAQNELQEGMTHEQARKSEHNFFDGLKWQGVRRRCGTSNLRDFLSEQLSHLILQEPLAAFQHSSQE
ncbi:MX1 [Symbiodinium natans]|uniref:MX1 protein n=1 Tax=Symbiodinium natans TaxID=878477 RepID=A0A812UKC1_9DINO|nr:MX1 [Symbiodinium natans]